MKGFTPTATTKPVLTKEKGSRMNMFSGEPPPFENTNIGRDEFPELNKMNDINNKEIIRSIKLKQCDANFPWQFDCSSEDIDGNGLEAQRHLCLRQMPKRSLCKHVSKCQQNKSLRKQRWYSAIDRFTDECLLTIKCWKHSPVSMSVMAIFWVESQEKCRSCRVRN